ncbi:hypothetical protein BC831DRAFT_550182 [Entophlyctis helioformis]|nr:hypothetical protein BC831DRAFT_550182 [Entophlyctis helioformis]
MLQSVVRLLVWWPLRIVWRFHETVFHAATIALVLASYISLFQTAITLQRDSWSTLLPRSFTYIVAPADGCNTDLPPQQVRLLLDVLDLTRNGRLTWGELVYPFQGDGRWAVVVYLDRWQQTRMQEWTVAHWAWYGRTALGKLAGNGSVAAVSASADAAAVWTYGLTPMRPLVEFGSWLAVE